MFLLSQVELTNHTGFSIHFLFLSYAHSKIWNETLDGSKKVKVISSDWAHLGLSVWFWFFCFGVSDILNLEVENNVIHSFILKAVIQY